MECHVPATKCLTHSFTNLTFRLINATNPSCRWTTQIGLIDISNFKVLREHDHWSYVYSTKTELHWESMSKLWTRAKKAVWGSHPKVFAAICWPNCRTTVTSTGWSQERGLWWVDWFPGQADANSEGWKGRNVESNPTKGVSVSQLLWKTTDKSSLRFLGFLFFLKYL